MKTTTTLVLFLALGSTGFGAEKVSIEEKFRSGFSKVWQVSSGPFMEAYREPPPKLKEKGKAQIETRFHKLDTPEDTGNALKIFPGVVKFQNGAFGLAASGAAGPDLELSAKIRGSEDGRAFRVYLLSADNRVFLIMNDDMVLSTTEKTFKWNLGNPDIYKVVYQADDATKKDIDRTLTFPLKDFALEFLGTNGETKGKSEIIEVDSVAIKGTVQAE